MRSISKLLNLIACIGIAIPASVASGQSVGDRAHQLEAVSWVANAGHQPVEIGDGPLVVEFWATWCAPCRLSISHMNQIANTLLNEKIQFAMISSEAPGVIQEYLNDFAINASVGCDTTRSVHESFGVTAVPRTFLVNPDGVICWDGHPMSLTAEIVREFARTGTCPGVQDRPDPQELLVRGSSGTVLTLAFGHSRFSLDPAPTGATVSQRSTGGRFEAEFQRQSLSSILATLLGVTRSRVRIGIPADEEPILDLALASSAPMTESGSRLEAVNALCQAFGLKITPKSDTSKAWALICSDPSKLVSTVGENSGTYSQHGIWAGTGMSFRELATTIESMFGEHVYASDLVEGRFDFEFPTSDFDVAMSVLKSRYGIEPRAESRERTIYTFERMSDLK